MSHDRWAESAAAWALGVLDASEVAEFENHLAGCAACRLAVQEFREVAGLLAHASEPVAAPAGLRERVGAMVREDIARREGATREATVADEAIPLRRRPAWRTPAVWLAAAGLLLAASTGMLWRRLERERDAAIVERLALERELSARDSILGELRGSRVHVVSLAAPDGGPPVARVFWNHERQRFVVTAFRLPAPRPGRAYQLWAIVNGKSPVSMGTFVTDSSGIATVVLPVGRDVDALGVIDLCAVTEEPAGGSSAPTESPRFVGAWRHTD